MERISPVKARGNRGAYFPNTEDLEPDEMRVIALGTGMPNGRLSQASASWLVELGNGDKFLFDIGTGCAANLGSLEIPYDYLDKIFISHLHTDHFGDFAAIFSGGWVGGRIGPLRIWGPSGATPELGIKYAMEHYLKALSWDIKSRAGRLPPTAGEIEVHEFDFKADNAVIFEENGAKVRSWPVPHAIDGAVGFTLEWKGLKFVFGGDCYPNNWFIDAAKGADIAIHECFLTAEDLIKKFRFPPGRALNVGTQVHTAPEAFGKVMSLAKPRMAVAYHFFVDPDIAPNVFSAIRSTYNGPLTIARDLTVFNITKDKMQIRETVPIENAWPAPLPRAPPKPDHKDFADFSDWIRQGRADMQDIIQPIYDRINKKYGLDEKP